MRIKAWEKEQEELESLRLKTAERLSWTHMEYSQDGYLVGHGPGRKDLKVVPSYARDIKAAWEVVEALNQQGADVHITNPRKDFPQFAVEIRFQDGHVAKATHPKAPPAICLAFIAQSAVLVLVLCLGTSLGAAAPGNEAGPPSALPSFLAPPPAAAAPASLTAGTAPPPMTFDSDSVEYPLGRGVPGLALLAGFGLQKTDLGTDGAPTVGLRYYFHKREIEGTGPETLSPWSIEVGALLPHIMSGAVGRRDGTKQYDAKVQRLMSENVAVQYRFAMKRPFRMNPEISLGIAMAQFHYDQVFVDMADPASTYAVSSKDETVFGPHARVGMPILANDWLSLRFDVGYNYLPFKADVKDRTFEAGVKGFGFYPSLHMSLGYLHSEIDKGVYLPDSSIPLWALSALQTEKRSPIIAPPEVFLNAHQAQTQGGLSGNVLFQYKNRTASKVDLMGDFNGWKPEPLYMDKAHAWITVKDLKAGVYHYTYLINSKREVRDPWNTSFDTSKRQGGSSVFVVQEVSPTF